MLEQPLLISERTSHLDIVGNLIGVIDPKCRSDNRPAAQRPDGIYCRLVPSLCIPSQMVFSEALDLRSAALCACLRTLVIGLDGVNCRRCLFVLMRSEMSFIRASGCLDAKPMPSGRKLPLVRLIVLTLKAFTVCPITYDGTFFHPQRKPYWSVLFAALIIAWIIGITITFLFFKSMIEVGHEHKGLFMMVAHAGMVFNIITNFLTLVVTIRDRHLLYECLSALHRLWQM